MSSKKGNINICILYLITQAMCEKKATFESLSEAEKVKLIWSKIYVINGKNNQDKVRQFKDSGKSYSYANGYVVAILSKAEIEQYKSAGRIVDIMGGSPENLFAGASLSGSAISVPIDQINKIHACVRMYRSLSPIWGTCKVQHSCWFIDPKQAELLGITGPTYDELVQQCEFKGYDYYSNRVVI